MSFDHSQLVAQGQLGVCVALGDPPYGFHASDGTPQGSDVDWSKAIAQRLGLKLVFVETVFDSIIASVQTGKCDIAVASATIRPARLLQVAMVPYTASGNAFMFKKGNPAGITGDPTSLCGKKVIGILGTVQVDQLKTWSSNCTSAGKGAIQIVNADSDTVGIQYVQSGQADVYYQSNIVIGYTVLQHPDQFEASGNVGSSSPAGIEINLTKTSLVNAVEKIALAMKADGSRLQLEKKWGEQSIDSDIPDPSPAPS